MKKFFLLSICLFVFISAHSQTLTPYKIDQYHFQYEYDKSFFKQMNEKELDTFRKALNEHLPNLDFVEGMYPKRSNELSFPYILIGFEEIFNPPFDVIEKEMKDFSINRDTLEKYAGKELPFDSFIFETTKPVIDRENEMLYFVVRYQVDYVEDYDIINMQVFKLGNGIRAMLSFYLLDNEERDINFSFFWDILKTAEFTEGYKYIDGSED